VRSFSYEKISTTTLPHKKLCSDERAKLRFFDIQANTLSAHKLYLAAKNDYQFIISKLPTNEQKFTLEPSLKTEIHGMLQAVAAKLCEAASWHTPAETL
jgi:hypothetical protein